jgi:type IV secretion system protein VirD4
MLLVIIKMIQANTSKANEYLHGSARWADQQDIKEAGLPGNDEGVYVGGWLDKNGEFNWTKSALAPTMKWATYRTWPP